MPPTVYWDTFFLQLGGVGGGPGRKQIAQLENVNGI